MSIALSELNPSPAVLVWYAPEPLPAVPVVPESTPDAEPPASEAAKASAPTTPCCHCARPATRSESCVGREYALCETCAVSVPCDCRHTARLGLLHRDQDDALRCPWCVALDLGFPPEDLLAELVGRQLSVYAAGAVFGDREFSVPSLAQDEATVDVTGIPLEDLCEFRTVTGTVGGVPFSATLFSVGSEDGRSTAQYIVREAR